jgi:hypothetical protein
MMGYMNQVMIYESIIDKGGSYLKPYNTALPGPTPAWYDDLSKNPTNQNQPSLISKGEEQKRAFI